jgi:aryl-alcohol dehydrogenase-like predicted oxidoreductase
VTIAAARGWAPLVAIQTEYSLVERAAERDLLPMAEGFTGGKADLLDAPTLTVT